MKRLARSTGMLAAALLTSAGQVPAEPPAARALWTIGSEDCVSVHSDGEPWDECGFQAFAMNAEGTRVLTVSSTGVIQLWDGEGRELRRLDWPNDPGGASGYPDGRALIVGDVGIAFTHYNQLALIRLSDGEILVQRVLDLMTVDEPRVVAAGRVFVEVRGRNWKTGLRELLVPSGELRAVEGATDLMRTGPGYWITGERPPFVIHRIGAEDVRSPRSCMPESARYCFWREDEGRLLHVFDLADGKWRSVDTGGFDRFTLIDFVDAAGVPFAVLCRPGLNPPGPCSIVDLRDGRRIYRFEAENVRAAGGLDEQGRPEIRLALLHGEDRRVAADGTMRVIDSGGRANLDPPGGGLIVPEGNNSTSLLVDADGRKAARLPFAAQLCGKGWPAWMADCRVSADGRRWLVPARSGTEAGGEQRLGLTLYEIPPVAARP